METMPNNVKFGGALGLLGGVICIAGMAIFFGAEESAIAEMGAYMLIAVMFFALAGGFYKDGQWSWNVLLLMTFLTIGAVGSAVVIGTMNPYVGAILVLAGAAIVASLSLQSSRTWTDRQRF